MKFKPGRNVIIGVVIASLVAVLALLFAAGCGGSDEQIETTPTTVETAPISPGTSTTPGTSAEPSNGAKVFTTQELATFDGKNGQPAYIAVDGIVYDVSGKPNWPQGEHLPCNLAAMAGQDLSEELDRAPSAMRGYVQSLPEVGRLSK